MSDVRHLPWGDFYLRMADLAAAYLAPGYDAIFYVMRGGMTPAHRLAHLLAQPPGGHAMYPLAIRRHEGDEVQSAVIEPEVAAPLPSLPPGGRLLLVEDTVGEGKTLMVALAALQALRPASVDVVTVGLDHRDWLMKSGRALSDSPLSQAVIGFDYWGWMVFPWENQAVEAFDRPPSLRPFRPGEAIVRPLELPDEAFAAVAGAVLGPGGPGPCVVLSEHNFREAASLPASSADWVVVRDLLPSRLELQHWRALAEVVKLLLRPGGRLVFAYLDRTRIQEPRDIVPHAEYYTPQLIERLLTKVGFGRVEHLGSSDRASFARATLPLA